MSKGKILVVADDDTIHDQVARVVGPKGYAISACRTGPEGLEIAKEVTPVLMVLGKNIPEVSSTNMIRLLRKKKEFKETPSIFLDDKDKLEKKIEGLENPKDEFFPRPFSILDLDKVISKVLDEPVNEAGENEEGWANDDLQFTQSQSAQRGSIGEIGMRQLLEYIGLNAITGELVLLYREGNTRVTSRLFARDGKIHRARIDNVGKPTNADLIYKLMALKSGKYDIRPRPMTVPDEIQKTIPELVEEGLRRLS